MISIFLHLDQYLNIVIKEYGVWTYLILFLIVFCETGLVVTPFLPGDSMLFAAGTFAALGSLDAGVLALLLVVAGVLGNSVNFSIGYFMGEKIPFREDARVLKKAYLDKTRRFYEKYGPMTIVISRFAPIIRTFAPFLAGVGKMNFVRFSIFNIAGALAWVVLFVYGGYFFGNIPVVKKNFTIVIMGIVVLSLMPTLFEVFRHWREAKKAEKGG